MQKYACFTGFLSYKYGLPADQLSQDFSEFCKEEQDKLSKESIEDDYKSFLDKYTDTLELEFNKEHKFQTNTRGIKIRGVYPTQEEAEILKRLTEKQQKHAVPEKEEVKEDNQNLSETYWENMSALNPRF